jgi:hypothetical protein
VANKKAQENHRVDGKCKSPESKNSREKRVRVRERVSSEKKGMMEGG